MNSAQFSDYGMHAISRSTTVGLKSARTINIQIQSCRLEFHVSVSILLTDDEGQFVLWCQIYKFNRIVNV